MDAMIRPSADLRNHYNEISRQCREERTPVIITVNGRGGLSKSIWFFIRSTRQSVLLLYMRSWMEEGNIEICCEISESII